jgi:hypothetical protein
VGFALFGILVIFVAFTVVIVAAVKGLGGKKQMDALEQGIAAGAVPELAEWNPSLLEWLSKDVIGGAYYYRPMGGARTEKLACTIPAWQGPATLLALSAELTSRRGEGRIEILARGWQVSLVLHTGIWHVTVNGRPLGAIDPTSGRLDDPHRQPIGACLRGPAGTQLQLRGADVAWIAGDPTLHAQRLEPRRPLLRLAAPLGDVEPVMWVLAAIGFSLGHTLQDSSRMV